ncbi:MAG: hypothetical protein ACKVP0_03290 [Pirellulaceae bacterium]
MPSDEGMPHGGAAAGAAASNRNQPNYSGAQGAAAGAAASNRNQSNYSGAQGAAAGAAAANRNQPQYSGAQGAAAGAAVANRNQPQFSGAAGAAAGYAAGQNNFGTGFGSISPSARYSAAAAIRGNFNGYGAYGAGWYTAHPGAWAAAGWNANNAWNTANWGSAAAWCSFNASAPVNYDYGTNVTYQDNSVYVGDQNVGTPAEYYQGAVDLAATGTAAPAPADGDWMPLGVFAFSKTGTEGSNVNIQLAVNKDGVIRGNYTDTVTNKTQLVQGSVDKTTQRVAFTVGNNTKNIVETGLYNLTKDEAPALIHFGQDRTEQWQLTRLSQDDNAAAGK